MVQCLHLIQLKDLLAEVSKCYILFYIFDICVTAAVLCFVFGDCMLMAADYHALQMYSGLFISLLEKVQLSVSVDLASVFV